MQLLTPTQIANFPVNHLSPSAIRTYLENRQAFFKRYVRLEFDESAGPAMVEGNLFHCVLEDFWSAKKEGYDEEIDDLFEKSLQRFELDGIFNKVNRGKTGSKEKSISTVKQALSFYANELPQFQKIEGTEIKFLSDFEDLDGNKMPVPLKGFCDLIASENGEFDIEDHKLVSVIVENGTPCPKFEIQAASYWFTVRKELGINPRRMIFRQVKKSKNREGGPQIVPYVVEYTSELLETFLELYRRIVKELAGIPLIDQETGIVQFLPNPYAQFGGEDARQDFKEEVSGKVRTLDEILVNKTNRFTNDDFEALDL